jgi:hypothetical protein
VVLTEGMLFVELANVEDGWLWYNGRIGIRPELEFDYFGKLVERAKCRMGNIDCEEVANATCGLLLEKTIIADAGWSLAPSFFWTR